MNKEMIISSTSHETRVAILEDDQVVEVFIEREHSRGVVGNIYKGRVSKVLPGMQSAFVDLGLERDAFLYVSDVISPTEEALEDEEDAGRVAAEPTDADPGEPDAGQGPLGAEGADRTEPAAAGDRDGLQVEGIDAAVAVDVIGMVDARGMKQIGSSRLHVGRVPAEGRAVALVTGRNVDLRTFSRVLEPLV